MSLPSFKTIRSWMLTSALLLAACSPGCTPPAKAPAAGEKASPAADRAPAQSPSAPAIESAPGVDLSGLNDAQKKKFYSLINSEPSACGKAHSLAKSLNEDKACRDSKIVAQFIVTSVKKGAADADIKEAASFVASSLKPRQIDNRGRPVFGNANAPVTVVVFADFECPHCAQEAPKVRKAVQSFNGKAKLVYRHFPLAGHDRARAAAVASEAALAQGKFWEFHDKVFQNQKALQDADLMKYAKEIGLDMARFKAHYAAKKGADAVAKDRATGEKLKLQGTPAVFVNGRYYNAALFGGSVEGWIDDALRR